MASESLHRDLVAPLELCEATRGMLLAILSRLTPGSWHARPSSGVWAVAEHVDHLIRAEVGTSKMARRLIRGDFSGIARPPEARLYDSRLDRYPYGRLPAPVGLVPASRPLEDATEELEAVHHRFIRELLRFDGPDPNALASPDPATGVWFTLAGWVRLQALHEEHHIFQIRALL